MRQTIEHRSNLDASVNFVLPTLDGGAFEARYVRRAPDYFCCYLSSHTGCNKGCKFCHLTAMKQTMMKPAKYEDLWDQVFRVMHHYTSQPKAKRVHINFMARGEALDNEFIHGSALSQLSMVFTAAGLTPRYNISTIMPKSVSGIDMGYRFSPVSPVIYYSLWSINKGWRQEWMPGAMEPDKAMEMLSEYQKATGALVKLHGAFIKDGNDGIASLPVQFLQKWADKFHFEFNVVRYNPYSEAFGQEADLDPIVQRLRYAGVTTKVIDRVGEDVAASCGTFLTGGENEL